ncbi:alkaline phosphatase family protein [Spirillospora sp. NPDC049652]
MSPRTWTGRRPAATVASVAAGVLALATAAACGTATGHGTSLTAVESFTDAAAARTATPIKHVVVLFDENNSFDHYFGTYPKAANTDGTRFTAARNTPRVNGLTKNLLTRNPNRYNPKRLKPSQALTCDQDHNYGSEQKAVNAGRMDRFVESTEKDKCTGQPVLFGEPGLVMDYYDGNTVTALWNYAQHYSMSDNSWDTVFGPSSPGAINLVSGQTHGIYAVDNKTHKKVTDPYVVQSPDKNGVGTMINDPQPAFDDCSAKNHTATNNLGVLTGPNVGDLLNKRKVTWGWFQGGFKPTGKNGSYAACDASHPNVGGIASTDYIPHHEPFQYYRSTANEKHLRPTSVAKIGHQDRANHQYDLSDFDAALKAGNLPSVSFLKAGAYQDGHAGYSDPLDEQRFLVKYVNAIQKSKFWKDTAIVVAYDDSDGWYDHQRPRILNGSKDASADSPALCGKAPVAGGLQDRCGPSQRLPLLVISPYSKVNHVDHGYSEQTSVLRFIEDNWSLGRLGGHSFDARATSLTGMFDFRHPRAGKLILDPKTGARA